MIDCRNKPNNCYFVHKLLKHIRLACVPAFRHWRVSLVLCHHRSIRRSFSFVRLTTLARALVTVLVPVVDFRSRVHGHAPNRCICPFRVPLWTTNACALILAHLVIDSAFESVSFLAVACCQFVILSRERGGLL